MENQLLARLESIEDRLEGMEGSLLTINYELGVLGGKVKNSIVPMLIKYVIFPLIVITGAVVGVKLIWL